MIGGLLVAYSSSEICFLESNGFSTPKIAGFVVGVTLSIIICIALILLTRRDKKLKGTYDERQQLVRGKGFKYAFFTMVVYYAMLGTIENDETMIFMDRLFGSFLGIIIGTAVYVMYTIINDGYIGLNDSRERTMIVMFMIGTFNALIAVMQAMDGELIEDGVVTYKATNFPCAALLYLVFFTMLIKGNIDKKNEMKDEDK